MRIFVDADACPKVIKEILFRASSRTKTNVILVANQFIATPPSPFISKIQVLAGFDAADDKIIENIQPGDVVITADIPLADEVVSKKCLAINPRGELYSSNNIKERLAMRNFNYELRNNGIISGGSLKLSKKEIQNFSDKLDQILRKKFPF